MSNPNLIDFYRNLIQPTGSGFGALYAMLRELGVEVIGHE